MSLYGVSEIEKSKKLIEAVCFGKIFSGEGSRAIESAKILVDKEITCDNRLNERDFGILKIVLWYLIGVL